MRLTEMHLRWRAGRERVKMARERYPELAASARNATWYAGFAGLLGAGVVSTITRYDWFDGVLRMPLLAATAGLGLAAYSRIEANRLMVDHLVRESRRAGVRFDLPGEEHWPIADVYCGRCFTHPGVRHRKDCTDAGVLWVVSEARRAARGRRD